MKLDLWFDFACPYCYVGHKLLLEGIKNSGKAIEINYRAFQLEPDNDNRDTIFLEKVKQRENLTDEQLNEKIDRIMKFSQENGLQINPMSIVDVNTRTAHKILKFPPEDKKEIVFDKIMSAYFVEGKDISDLEMLKDILGKSGVNFDGISKYNVSEEPVEELRIDRLDAEKIWFEKIPYAKLENGKVLEGVYTKELVAEFLADAE